MKALIVEDETAAARNLKVLLAMSYPQIDIVATVESVTDATEWFATNPMPDLVFMDIHLADGNAFRIFDSTVIKCPIIFTTAYDQYALDAFRVNSIDYILKPIKQADLERAVEKFLLLTANGRNEYAARVKELAVRQVHKTILVHVKDKIIPLTAESIAFFHICDEKVTVTTSDGKCYPVDKTLEALAADYSGDGFFRANRQFIIARSAVKDISVWFGSRLSINLSVCTPERIIISKARVPEFKEWLAGR